MSHRTIRAQRSVVGGCFAYALFYLFLLAAHPGGARFYRAFLDGYELLPEVFVAAASLLCARRAAPDAPLRRAGWLLVGVAALFWMEGQAGWVWYEAIRGVRIPQLSWADIGNASISPLMLAGVVLLFGSMPVASRTRLVLDSALAASSLGILSWHYLVQPLWHKSGVPLISKFVSVFSVGGDIACLFGALLLFNSLSQNRALRRSVLFLAAGIALWVFADGLNVYDNLADTMITGVWYEWGWYFAGLLIGYSALLQFWNRDREQAGDGVGETTQRFGTGGLLRVLAPYAAVAVSLLLVGAGDYHTSHTISKATYLSGLGLILLVIMRQVFTLMENLHLTRQLRSFNENLEETVAQRTRQLASLHGLTKAVNTTLDADQVTRAALEHAPQAICAQSALLWLDAGDSTPVLLEHGLGGRRELRDALASRPILEAVDLIPLDGGEGACLRAPLRWQERVLGMIGVVRERGAFGSPEVQMLESIGLEVGTALENARRYRAALDAADHDPVTDLLNHRAIHQRLDAELVSARSEERPLSLVMMDMNNFKLFNDTYGHPVGDEVLRTVARVLQSVCGPEAALGRYGGDEFLVLLPQHNCETATAVCRRVRQQLANQGFVPPGETRTIPIDLSFGIASCPDDGHNRHELLTLADVNLYTAKRSEAGIVGTTAMQRTHRLLGTEDSFNVLDTLVTSVDNKDAYTRRHSEDVTEYGLWIAEELGLSDETMRVIRIGGLLHDIGKIGVPDEILRKPGRLTPEEYEVLKRHPRLGALIVGAIPGMEEIVDAVRSHHERWDGGGYPDGTEGKATPMIGRLMAVADAFSAITTDRPYRRGADFGTALAEIRANIGTQFDPVMAHAFLRAAERRRPSQEQLAKAA